MHEQLYDCAFHTNKVVAHKKTPYDEAQEASLVKGEDKKGKKKKKKDKSDKDNKNKDGASSTSGVQTRWTVPDITFTTKYLKLKEEGGRFW